MEPQSTHILLHTCGGLKPNVSEDWPKFLSANGHAALSVDTFGSRNVGRCPDAFHLGGPTMTRDAYGALDYLASRADIDPNRIAEDALGHKIAGRHHGQTRLRNPRTDLPTMKIEGSNKEAATD